MAAKKCRKCGKGNPPFFTHCVECGTPLVEETRIIRRDYTYLKVGLVLCVLLIVVVFVIIPAARLSMTVGQNFSETMSTAGKAQSLRVEEYPASRTVEDGGLRIMVSSARSGVSTFDANRFFIVSVNLENTRSEGNLQVTNNDFELIDTNGAKYFAYGIGSKVMYDLGPARSMAGELTFIIPENVTAEKVRFTFPGSSALASDRRVVMFVLPADQVPEGNVSATDTPIRPPG